MLDSKFIDELSRKLSDVIPPGARALRDDFERNIRAVLNSSFQKLDLVTREEFEVQSEVLAKTRAKLNAMERQMAALEARLGAAEKEEQKSE